MFTEAPKPTAAVRNEKEERVRTSTERGKERLMEGDTDKMPLGGSFHFTSTDFGRKASNSESLPLLWLDEGVLVLEVLVFGLGRLYI